MSVAIITEMLDKHTKSRSVQHSEYSTRELAEEVVRQLKASYTEQNKLVVLSATIIEKGE